jgi:hypothetical protein
MVMRNGRVALGQPASGAHRLCRWCISQNGGLSSSRLGGCGDDATHEAPHSSKASRTLPERPVQVLRATVSCSFLLDPGKNKYYHSFYSMSPCLQLLVRCVYFSLCSSRMKLTCRAGPRTTHLTASTQICSLTGAAIQNAATPQCPAALQEMVALASTRCHDAGLYKYSRTLHPVPLLCFEDGNYTSISLIVAHYHQEAV